MSESDKTKDLPQATSGLEERETLPQDDNFCVVDKSAPFECDEVKTPIKKQIDLNLNSKFKSPNTSSQPLAQPDNER